MIPTKDPPLGRSYMVGVFYGTVRLVEYGRVGVEFDEWIGGHEFFAHDDVDCERGHGWYFFGDDFLDKIEDDGDDALVEIDSDILFY